MWDEYATTLSKRYRVVRIDLPGHGKSDCQGYVHSMELMAECVKAVLEHLNLRRVLLVGHSMGGYVALAFAEQFPDHIKGLCLFHSTARSDSPQKKLGRDRAIELVKTNHRSFVRKAVPLLFRPKNRTTFKEDIKELKKQALQTSKQGIIACLIGMRDRHNRELILRFAPYPVQIMVGTHDTAVPFESVKPQLHLAEHSFPVVLEGVGHMGFVEAKEEVFQELQRFARKCLF